MADTVLALLAVHVLLDRDQIRSILSLYHLGAPEDFAGIAEGSINTAYWVVADGRKLFLRITEGKQVQDMVFERTLLERLRGAALPVPVLLSNVAGGTFTPWSEGGRYVSLFEFMEGRELGTFEVRPDHVFQVGAFAARMHRALEGLSMSRENEFRLENLQTKTDELVEAVGSGRLPDRLAKDIGTLRDELARQAKRDLRALPSGTVHGDLFIDNCKFDSDRLVGIIDFEMSSSDRYTWELGVLINAWCWEPSPDQQGGPSGRFDAPRIGAALRGYASERALDAGERNALPDELRLAAARFAVTRLYDFELNPLPPGRRVYKDYRHYLARLNALGDGRAEAVIAGVDL